MGYQNETASSAWVLHTILLYYYSFSFLDAGKSCQYYKWKIKQISIFFMDLYMFAMGDLFSVKVVR